MAENKNCCGPCCQNDETKYTFAEPLYLIKTKLSKTIDTVCAKYIAQRDFVNKLQSNLYQEIVRFRRFFDTISQPRYPIDFDTKSILVFNLNNDVQIQDLVNHFQVCGIIAEVDMIFEDTRFLGKARVTFQEDVYALIALSMNQTILLNHPVFVLPWHLDRNIEIVKAIVKEWRNFLLPNYPAAASVIDNLRILNAIGRHRYELTCLYLKSRVYDSQRNSKEIDLLIVDAIESLRLVGKYPVCYEECDVDFDSLDKPQYGYPFLDTYMKS